MYILFYKRSKITLNWFDSEKVVNFSVVNWRNKKINSSTKYLIQVN